MASELAELFSMIEGEDLDVGEMVDLINGEDLDVGAVDLIGASRGARGKLGALMAARALQRGKVSTVRSMGAKARVLFLGGEEQATSPAPVVITIKAQEDYRPDRVLISAVDSTGAIVANATLKISDIRIGTRSQFSSIGNITADLFRPDFFSNGGNLELDTIQAGTDLSIQISAASATLANPVTINVSCQGRSLR